MATKLGLQGEISFKEGGQAGAGAWIVMENVRDVTLNLEKAEADMTTRAADGWRELVATLKTLSIEFEMVHDPADAAYAAMRDSFLNDEIVGIRALDSPGGVGFSADMMAFGFTKTEPLEDGQKVSVVLKVTRGATPVTVI